MEKVVAFSKFFTVGLLTVSLTQSVQLSKELKSAKSKYCILKISFAVSVVKSLIVVIAAELVNEIEGSVMIDFFKMYLIL